MATTKETKYKVTDLAPDFGVSAKELSLTLQEIQGTEKKKQSLIKDEIDLLLCHFTARAEVENFDAYRADTSKTAPTPVVKAEKPKKSAATKTLPKESEVISDKKVVADDSTENRGEVASGNKVQPTENKPTTSEKAPTTENKPTTSEKKAQSTVTANAAPNVTPKVTKESTRPVQNSTQTATGGRPLRTPPGTQAATGGATGTTQGGATGTSQAQNRPVQNNNQGQNRPVQNNNQQGRPVQNNNQGQNRPVQNNQQGQNRPVQNNNQQGQNRPNQNNNQGQRFNQNQGQGRPNQNNQQGQRFNQNQGQGQRSAQNNNNQQGRATLENTKSQSPSRQEAFQRRVENAAATAAAPKTTAPKTTTSTSPKHSERTKLNTTAIADSTTVERKQHTVDTRGTYVELDKYNERYEQIAPADNHSDDFRKKQKINQKPQKSADRRAKQFSAKKETEQQRLERLALERARKQQLRISIPNEIQVSELALRLKVNVSKVITKLMKLGVMASMTDFIDFDTASLVAEDLGAKVEKELVVSIEERLIDETVDNAEDLVTRDPVVVVMGHVDHGKTSLLDKIRNTNVVEGEAGGITQHIGAYRVDVGGRDITFLDTPGHEAFTSMRARGAKATDIAILVVAADDGIMPQTVEAINHAKAANIAIIVAINKIDKDGANPDKVKQELTEHGLVIEEWGGDIICCEVSAKAGIGIDNLLENVLLVADVQELKANPNRKAKGIVIEAKLDKGRGPVATLLVQSGTLNTSDIVIVGTAVGKIRVMTNDKHRKVKTAGPSVPVEITGLSEVPSAGDIFNVVDDEKLARALAEERKNDIKEAKNTQTTKITLENLFSHIQDGKMKELPIIVKADVQGSVEAVKQSLEKISNEEVRVKVIHSGVGAISENDVMLANASNAIIVGFNVRPDPIAAESASRDGVDLRMYRIIYSAIEEIEQAMKGMLDPKFREVVLGRSEVRKVMKLSTAGIVAGCYVLTGKVTRDAEIRVVRDGIVIAEDKMSSLQRFKDSVKEVAAGYECGITLEKYTDIKDGDILEAFINEEIKP